MWRGEGGREWGVWRGEGGREWGVWRGEGGREWGVWRGEGGREWAVKGEDSSALQLPYCVTIVFILAAAIRKKIELNAHTKDETYLNHIRT